MELQGKIIKLLPLRSGVSQSGKAWQSLDAVLETTGQYQRKMVFTVFGEDRIKKFALFEGMECNVQFDIDAHEYQGKWYNSVTAFNVTNTDLFSQQAEQPQPGPIPQTVIYPDKPKPAPQPQQIDTDDSALPF